MPEPAGAERVVDVPPVSAQVCRPASPSVRVADRVEQPVQPPTFTRPMIAIGMQSGQDHEELQHLVVDRRGEATEGDVGEHDRRADHDREPQRPAEQRLHDQREGVEVDAGDEHLGDARSCIALSRWVGRLKRQPQVLGDAADLGAVVEGHHDDAEEHHGRHGADPVVVDGHDAVLARRWRPCPRISSAPRLAEMKARPVTQAGSERPDRKKSSAGLDATGGRRSRRPAR